MITLIVGLFGMFYIFGYQIWGKWIQDINSGISLRNYTEDEIDEKFDWIAKNAYTPPAPGKWTGRFTFTKPGHGDIWMTSDGTCWVWDSSGDGTIRPIITIDGRGWKSFKRYVVSAYDERIKYDKTKEDTQNRYSNRIKEMTKNDKDS